MLKRIIPGLLLLTISFVAIACSRSTATSNQLIIAKWITAQVSNDSVSIPVTEVKNDKIIHFFLKTQNGDKAFMAYELKGKLYIRANICPPCNSRGFSLRNDTLICDTCKTVFDAKTGNGIRGACVDYPKASVLYEIVDNKLIIKTPDLISAYQNTIKPGLP